MRFRAIRDNVYASESLAALSHGAERLYWRLLSASDSHGRQAGSISKIRARALGAMLSSRVTDDEIAAWLVELEQAGRVQRYAVDGVDYVQIADFDGNQPADLKRKRGSSEHPEPPIQAVSAVGQTGADRGLTEVEQTREEDLPAPTEPQAVSEPEPLSNGTLEAALQQVYGYWRERRGKSRANYDRISPARRRVIATRLKEFTVEDLCRAIDGVAVDESRWPDRALHDDLTIIFRRREQVDKFLELADQPDPPIGGGAGKPPPRRFGRGVTAAEVLGRIGEEDEHDEGRDARGRGDAPRSLPAGRP